MCIACSQWWYCTDSDMTSEEDCPNPMEQDCKDGKCDCSCHKYFHKDPAISVPEKHSRHTTWLNTKEKEWASKNFNCTYHVFEFIRETVPDEKYPNNRMKAKYTGKHHYSDCIYCDTTPLMCSMCGYDILNRKPGEIQKCKMTHCKGRIISIS